MQSIAQLLRSATGQLGSSDSPRLDAEVLLATVLGTDRSHFYAHPEMMAPPTSAADFMRLLHSRRAGYPIAYLTGQKEFRSMAFQVNRHTLIPRPETELLVETALERIPGHSRARVLDLGTGSGAIAVSVATARPRCAVTAVDVSAGALAVARENAKANHAPDISFRHSDWFGNLHDSRFDVILCNPPYVCFSRSAQPPDEIRYEPRLALDGGYNGVDCIRIIIAAAIKHITPGGFMIIEHAHDQGDFVRQHFRINHYRDITTRYDHAGHERCTCAVRP